VASAASSLTSDDMMIDVHHQVAARTVRDQARTIRRHYLAKLAAAKLAAKKAAAQAAKQQAAAAAAAAAKPTASPSPAPSSSGSTDAAHSPLGVCIRNAEEGGSYAWGPGNGGGAYQFVLGTWENYGGSASEFGVAGPAYQDQIFDNAIAAGGASNWTAYDGC
jgi:pyruvate/2-oxoglutarate dehydrogenase complex dihydrolipoamide acyltransferase (E2) component